MQICTYNIFLTYFFQQNSETSCVNLPTPQKLIFLPSKIAHTSDCILGFDLEKNREQEYLIIWVREFNSE